MRILVTGNKGYIGTRLVPLLLEKGHEVHGLDSDLYASSTFGAPPVEIPQLRMDIRDVEPCHVEGFEAIIHLAALSNDPLGDLNPSLTYEINHHATVRLAELAKAVGVSRFLFSSSCSTYGAAGNGFLDETASFNPVTPYGETKVWAERDLSKLASSSFSPVYLRNATAYGVSPRLRFDLVLNNLVAWAYTTGRIYLKSDGTPWRPLVHIEDISRAFIAMVEAPRALIHNEAFNVGRTEENYQICQLAEIVGETVSGCHVEIAQNAGPDLRNYRVDCSKIATVLSNYKPQWDVRRSALELYETYRRIGLKWEDFEGPRYKRLTHIKELLQTKRLDSSLRWNQAATEHVAA